VNYRNHSVIGVIPVLFVYFLFILSTTVFYPSISTFLFSSLSLIDYLFCLLYTLHSAVSVLYSPGNSHLIVLLVSHTSSLQHGACRTRKTPCISLTHAPTPLHPFSSLYDLPLSCTSLTYGHLYCSRHCPMS
jgi:hypothetical protein